MKKPKLRTETIQISFWECDSPNHRHRTREVAQRCIKTTQEKKQRAQTAPKHVWDGKALSLLLSQFRSGKRKADLARQYDLSASHIANLIAQAERLERLGKLNGFIPHKKGMPRQDGRDLRRWLVK